MNYMSKRLLFRLSDYYFYCIIKWRECLFSILDIIKSYGEHMTSNKIILKKFNYRYANAEIINKKSNIPSLKT